MKINIEAGELHGLPTISVTMSLPSWLNDLPWLSSVVLLTEGLCRVSPKYVIMVDKYLLAGRCTMMWRCPSSAPSTNNFDSRLHGFNSLPSGILSFALIVLRGSRSESVVRSMSTFRNIKSSWWKHQICKLGLLTFQRSRELASRSLNNEHMHLLVLDCLPQVVDFAIFTEKLRRGSSPRIQQLSSSIFDMTDVVRGWDSRKVSAQLLTSLSISDHDADYGIPGAVSVHTKCWLVHQTHQQPAPQHRKTECTHHSRIIFNGYVDSKVLSSE